MTRLQEAIRASRRPGPAGERHHEPVPSPRHGVAWPDSGRLQPVPPPRLAARRLGDAGRGTRVGDWFDLLVPLLVLTPALLTLLAARADRASYVLFGVGAWLYVSGHGIHLAANSIWNVDPSPTAELWDEYAGHWLWYAGVALVAAALARTMLGRPRPTQPAGLGAGPRDRRDLGHERRRRALHRGRTGRRGGRSRLGLAPAAGAGSPVARRGRGGRSAAGRRCGVRLGLRLTDPACTRLGRVLILDVGTLPTRVTTQTQHSQLRATTHCEEPQELCRS